jgi:alpha-tubulin suppressor-like RCC1 family protein
MDVCAGFSHVLVLKGNGRVYAFGRNIVRLILFEFLRKDNLGMETKHIDS